MSRLRSDPPESGHPRRVLLVEDNEAANRGLAKLLEAYGFEVTKAYDGASALEALAGGLRPDFVLTDLQLPDLDGRDVARSARSLVPPPRVALITGWDLEPQNADMTASGIDWVLTKPIDIQDLISKLLPASSPNPPASDEAV